MESEVRGYVRSFPTVFDVADGAIISSAEGKQYIDFFAGAGTLNYGHNPDEVNNALINYLKDKRIVHGLDKATVAKIEFMEAFAETILKPRNLDYKLQFTGPTGTNAVEAALKLARKAKERSHIISFTNAYHGHTLGALAVTGNSFYHHETYGANQNVTSMPFCGYFGDSTDTLDYLRKMLDDTSSGLRLPAAIIAETVQGEGGINIASNAWLQGLEQICKDYDILLIIDDIQVGNGRTGDFFSFEASGIKPDMVCLSKSIGGGLPMALLLIRPEIDVWQPGEHTGTFRGNNLAFVAAKELLKHWKDDKLSLAVKSKGKFIEQFLIQLKNEFPELAMQVRGRGMVWGLEIPIEGFADKVSKAAFTHQLLIETCGSTSSIIKLLPPLIIDTQLLEEGLEKLAQAIRTTAKASNVQNLVQIG